MNKLNQLPNSTLWMEYLKKTNTGCRSIESMNRAAPFFPPLLFSCLHSAIFFFFFRVYYSGRFYYVQRILQCLLSIFQWLLDTKRSELKKCLNGWAFLSFVIAGRSGGTAPYKPKITWEEMRKGHFVYFVTCGMIDSVKTQSQTSSKYFKQNSKS